MSRQVDTDSTVEIEAAELPTRRGFLGTLTKTALGVVAGVAHLWSSTESAWADGYHYACCHLAKSPSGGYCAYNCWRYSAQGYHEASWTCTYGSTLYYCFECTQGPNCWYGPWLCSDYFPA